MREALDAMRHRGPDQEGWWAGDLAMLGHRRLSIIDLSEQGRQPMSDVDERIHVVLNGEIYNFEKLRRELASKHQFRSRTDTEVLVHGFKEWGIEGLLDRVTGMFAFAIVDSASGTAHLARDRVGKKPLYYAVRDGSLLFASTLPALLKLLPETPSVRAEAIQDFLLHLCVPGEASILEGVQKLLPAHRLEFCDGAFRLHRYWSLSFQEQDRDSEHEWLDRIDEALDRAVRARLVSDVKIGAFLSGGVDSSLVTALMAQASSRQVVTISAGFEESGFSELPYARRVAAHLGTDHHEQIVSVSDMVNLPRVVHSAGEPFGDHALLPTMSLARVAREHVTVVLTGDGGDEAFAGYPGPLLARLAGVYSRTVPFVALRQRAPSALQAVERLIGLRNPARRLRRLAVLARSRGITCEYDALGERGFRGRFSDLFTADFGDRLTGRDPDTYWRRAFALADGPTNADRLLFTELTTLLPDQFLAKVDVGTMAYGIEARSPMLDADLLTLTARIPAAMKTRRFQPKYLLKRLAARYVPKDVLYRRKQGFSPPTDAWMRGPMAGTLRQVVLSDTFDGRNIFRKQAIHQLVQEHESGRANHGQRLWLLVMLELWMRMFIDRSVHASDELEVGPRVRGAA
jgi:asparagine synthase (glutamine-hydrolysing)